MDTEALMKQAIAAQAGLSPEHDRAQRISWVYGNLVIDNPSLTREVVEQAAKVGH